MTSVCFVAQAAGGDAAALTGRWSVGVTMEILRNEGLRGWGKGLPARLYRSAPGHGMLYMGFEFFSGVLRSGGRETTVGK